MRAMQRLAILVLAVGACSEPVLSPTVYFDLTGSTRTADTFWNLPFPSDLRLDPPGAPHMTGFPNPRNVAILNSLMLDIPDRRGWPQMSTSYFQFTVAVPDRAIGDVIADGSAMLLDIDPASPENGASY